MCDHQKGSYWCYALLAIPPVAVVLAGEIVLALFVPPGPEFLGAYKTSATSTLLSIEISSRLKILGLFLLICVISVGISARFLRDYFRLDSRPKKLAALGSAAICLAGAAIVIGCTSSGSFTTGIALLGTGTFTAASDLIASGSADAPSGLGALETTLDWATVLVSLATIAIITGSISCLFFPSQKGAEPVWIANFGRFKHYSYVAAALLVVGVLFYHSRALWPIFAFSEPCADAKEAAACVYQSQAEALTVFVGVQYSLLLLSFGIPIAASFNAKADEIAKVTIATLPADQAVTIAQYREANGLTISLFDQIKAPLVFFAPMLAGGFAGIWDLLKGN